MDDVISRQNAIRWVRTEWNPYGKPTLEYNSGLKVIKHLEKMPSALLPVDRPKGEWVDKQDGTFCSECDYKTNEYHNFCPNCGADMRGEK